MVLATVIAAVAVTASAADRRIAFKRPAGWTNTPHIHAYANDVPLPGCDNQEMTAVPGKAGWYWFTIYNAPEQHNVMFNNGGWSGGQTGPLYLDSQGDRTLSASDGDVISVADEGVWDAIDDAPTPQPAATSKIRFHRPDDWNGVPRLIAYKEKNIERTATNRVIYEVFVRNFSPEGTFKGVERQVSRLKELGVDIVWLMPIYTMGEQGKWGTYASPYAVRDYKAVSPEYGSSEDLRSLVNAIHAAGMEVWLDWVANHTALDHAWVSQHREYYRTSGGNIVNPHGWNDVYQLDYSNNGLRSAMIDALQYWVREFDIDGYRCDYADGVPRDFWRQARAEVNKIKPIGWLAESGGDGENAKLVSEDGIFDYNYAWGFRDKLAEFAGHGDVNTLKRLCSELFYDNAYNGKSRMVYLSNHDVVQDKGGTEDRTMGARLAPLTVLQFTVYGMPLIYNGQEIKYSSAPIVLAEKTPIDWNSGDANMTSLIKSLTTLKHSEPALRTAGERGDLINYDVTHSSVYVYERRLGSESVVVMLNFSGTTAEFNVNGNLPSAPYLDVFSGTSRNLASADTFSLPPYGYAVYVK